MLKYCSFLILLLFLNSCLINRFRFDDSNKANKPIKTEFCKLIEFDSSKLVKVRAIYSGVDEYWGLESTQKCEINNDVDFDFNNNTSIRNGINAYFLGKRLKKLYHNYMKYSVELEITGYFERDLQNGFGHLGHNKYQLNAKRVRIVRFIKKQKPKI